MNNTTIYQQFQAAESDTWFAATLMVLLNTAAMIFNMFLLFLVFKSRGLRTLENSFIVNLIAFDLACTVTLIGIVIYWYLYLTIPQRITVCYCIMTFLNYITTGQFASLLAMAIDRYIKIVHPFTHIKICTKIYVFWILLVVHLVSAAGALGLGLQFTWDPKDACFFTYTFSQSALTVYQLTVLAGLLAILIFNVKILIVSKQQKKQIHVATRSSRVYSSSSISRSQSKILGSLTLFTFITYVPNWILLALSAADVTVRTPAHDFITITVALLWNIGLLFWSLDVSSLSQRYQSLCSQYA